MSPTELNNKFNLKCTFLQAHGIMCAIPSSWKSKIRELGKRLPVVKSQNIERLFKTKEVNSFTYDVLRNFTRNFLENALIDFVTIFPWLRQLCQVQDPDAVFPKLPLVDSYAVLCKMGHGVISLLW